MREVIVRWSSAFDSGRWSNVGDDRGTTRPQNHEELEQSWLLPLWACQRQDSVLPTLPTNPLSNLGVDAACRLS